MRTLMTFLYPIGFAFGGHLAGARSGQVFAALAGGFACLVIYRFTCERTQ